MPIANARINALANGCTEIAHGIPPLYRSVKESDLPLVYNEEINEDTPPTIYEIIDGLKVKIKYLEDTKKDK